MTVPPGRDHHHLRGEGGRAQAVEHHDVVPVGLAAEVLQGQLGQPLPEERGRDLVVEERDVARIDPQSPLEAREVEDRVGAVLLDPGPDDLPRLSELGEIILGAAQDGSSRIRETGGDDVPKSVGGHGTLLLSIRRRLAHATPLLRWSRRARPAASIVRWTSWSAVAPSRRPKREDEVAVVLERGRQPAGGKQREVAKAQDRPAQVSPDHDELLVRARLHHLLLEVEVEEKVTLDVRVGHHALHLGHDLVQPVERGLGSCAARRART